MKLLYAGQGVSAKSYTQLQFNCTRNDKCQKAFYVPVNLFSDIVLYADLAGKPTIMSIEVMDACGDVDNTGTAVSSNYVIGQTSSGSWYATIGSLVVTPPLGVTYTRFFFKLSFTIGGIVHVFYSQQYEFPWCTDLLFVRGCYPNEAIGSEAIDCNDIYYGFPTNEDFLGNENYRYIHSALVRDGSVIEQRNTMSFTAFNSKKTYKAVLLREWLFEFELVPTFFKNVIIGIMNRGNVQVGGTEYKLAESQNISIIDVDSKLWKMDMIFDAECKQSFGCKPMDCVLPVDTCTGNPTSVTMEEDGDNYLFTLEDGTLEAGDTIEWEVRDQVTNTLIDSGTISAEPLEFIIDTVEHPTFDPVEACYVVKWRKCCPEIGCSEYATQEVGNCGEPSECEEAGFAIIGGVEPVYAALFWSADEVDYSSEQECSGNFYNVPGLGWKVYIGFYKDAALTIPQIVSLTSYTVNVNGTPYVLNGTGFAFFIANFIREVYELSPDACSLTGPDIQPLPTLDSNDCFTGASMTGSGIAAGKIRMQRAVDDTLPGPRMNVALNIINGVSGPNTMTEMETFDETTLNAFYGKVLYQFETPGSHNGTITITDGIETEIIPGPFFSIGVSQGFDISTKNFILDPNHDIVVTFDAA